MIKKIGIFSLILVIGILVSETSANCQGKRVPLEPILGGEHALVSFDNAGVLVPSSYDSEAQALKISFNWKMNDGSFASSELSIKKIVIKEADAENASPSIKFSYTQNSGSENLGFIMDYHVYRAVVTLSKSDFKLYLKALKQDYEKVTAGAIESGDQKVIVLADDSQDYNPKASNKK